MGGIKAFQIFYKTIGKVVGKQAHKADDAVSIMVKPPKYPARNTPEYWARHRNSRLTSRISPDANPLIETKSEALGLFDKFKTKIKKRCAIRKAKEQQQLQDYLTTLQVGVPKSVISYVEKDFEKIKHTAIKVLKERNADPKLIKYFSQCKTPEELVFTIRNSFQAELIINPYCQIASNDLRIIQEQYKAALKSSDNYIDLIKAITPESSNQQVKEIEAILRNNYGIKFASLYSPDEAQKALEAVKIAKANNVPLPENYIVSPFSNIGQNGTNFAHYDWEKRSIVVQPENIVQDTINLAENKLGVLKRKLAKLAMKIIPNFSTKSPIHLHLHELTHSEKRCHLFFDSKPLPKDVKGGLKDVGAYAKISGSREEIRTELRVKQMLEGLSDEGEKTLEYLS